MANTRVKICGITQVEDALFVARSGADAIGLVFYDKSPRCITLARAGEISRALPAFVTSVALFKDAPAETVADTLQQVNIDLLQFHGSESAEYCRQFGKPYIKALGMDGEVDLERRAEAYFDARALLLDSHAPGADGGTGEPFDWTGIPKLLPLPLILAGGLTPDNVAEAIKTVQPYAVDVSSGVERDKGIKDEAKVMAFMQQVRKASVDH